MSPLRKVPGSEVRAARVKLGLTIEELAECLEVLPSTARGWELRGAKPLHIYALRGLEEEMRAAEPGRRHVRHYAAE